MESDSGNDWEEVEDENAGSIKESEKVGSVKESEKLEEE